MSHPKSILQRLKTFDFELFELEAFIGKAQHSGVIVPAAVSLAEEGEYELKVSEFQNYIYCVRFDYRCMFQCGYDLAFQR